MRGSQDFISPLDRNLNRYQFRLNKSLIEYDAYFQCALNNFNICDSTIINESLEEIFNGINSYKYSNYESLDLDSQKVIDKYIEDMEKNYNSPNKIDFFQYIKTYYTEVLGN